MPAVVAQDGRTLDSVDLLIGDVSKSSSSNKSSLSELIFIGSTAAIRVE